MPAIFTQLGIWNKAVYKIGAMRLASLTDSTNVAATYLADIWPFELAEIFEEHPWSFAVQTVPLIPLNPPLWLTSTSYAIGNYVLYGGQIYVCMLQYTSSSSFTTDLALGYWQLCYPTNVPQNPPTWNTGIAYTTGCAVFYNNAIYQCVVNNTSSASFSNDLSAGYWALVYSGSLAPAAWVTSTLYTVGQFVTQAGNIYLCTVQNTSGTFATDLANGYWSLHSPISPLIQPLPIMNDGCNNPYALPTDFINPYKFGAPAFYRKETVGAPYLPTPTVILMCNNSNIPAMKYVSAYPNIASWSSKFCEALATKLGYQLCFKISEAAQYAVGLEKDYQGKLISAIAADSNTTSPDESIADKWFIARLVGNTGAIGVGQDNNSVGWGIPGVDFGL